MTIRRRQPTAARLMAPLLNRSSVLMRVYDRLFPARWFRPRKERYVDLRLLAAELNFAQMTHLEFMLLSSELMPEGSPDFSTEADIDGLFEFLEELFAALAPRCTGMTLAQLHHHLTAGSTGA